MKTTFRLCCLVMLIIASVQLEAQYDIKIQVKNYDNDTLIVGYFFAEKQLVKDTLLAHKKGKFRFTGKDTLDNGIYILLTNPDNQYVQFHINEGDTDFDIEFDHLDKSKIKFKGSTANTAFQNYLTLIMEKRPRAQILRDTIAVLKEKNKPIESFDKELATMDNLITKAQVTLVEADTNSIAANILKASKDVEVPLFEGEENLELKKFNYYKAHYFDNLDLGNPQSMNIGLINNKIDTYIKRLTSNNPDSVMASLDYLLTSMAPAPKTYKYYLGKFINKYARTKVVGYDAVYVYLSDTYYNKDKAPWASEETLEKISRKANDIRPSLIGKIGADLTVYAEDGKTPVTLSEIDYEYLVLIFWAPDCGHCTKMMPKFVEINDRWKDTGVKTFAICSKHQDKTASCWESLKDKNMLGFINAADQYHRSRFKVKYNVVSTPRVYILDKDRKILMKGIGANQLEEVLLEVLTMEKREDLIPEAAREVVKASKEAAIEAEKQKKEKEAVKKK